MSGADSNLWEPLTVWCLKRTDGRSSLRGTTELFRSPIGPGVDVVYRRPIPEGLLGNDYALSGLGWTAIDVVVVGAWGQR